MKRLQIYVLNMNFFTSTFTALLESELFVSVKAPTHSQLLCTSWIRLHTTINKANLNEQCPTVLNVMGRSMIPFFNLPNPILILLLICLQNSGPMHQISAEFSCSWLLLENWPVHDFGLRADWTCEWKLSCEDGMDSVCTITSHLAHRQTQRQIRKYGAKNKMAQKRWNGFTRLEICQMFYTTRFLGQKFYTVKTLILRLFWLTIKLHRCHFQLVLSLFLLKLKWICKFQ